MRSLRGMVGNTSFTLLCNKKTNHTSTHTHYGLTPLYGRWFAGPPWNIIVVWLPVGASPGQVPTCRGHTSCFRTAPSARSLVISPCKTRKYGQRQGCLRLLLPTRRACSTAPAAFLGNSKR